MGLVKVRWIIVPTLFSWLALSADAGLRQTVATQHMKPLPIERIPGAEIRKVAYPIKLSGNRRYFVDRRGAPVFWLGTTQWNLFRGFSLDDARVIFENAKAKGFAFVQVKILGGGDGRHANIRGEKPFTKLRPLMPNESYFKHIDAIMQIAQENNTAVSITIFHQRYREYITVENARAWAEWVAERYEHYPNIVWSITPEARQEFVPILRELAKGLRSGDGGRRLITCKPDPAPYSSSFLHDEEWLDFNSIQTWKSIDLIYPMVTKDYHLKSAKPVLLAEGAYEDGPEYGFDITPLWIRRQAYYSYLSGGHHAYGHNDSWRILPTWEEALDAPGAVQLGILKKIFLGRKEWWELVPDQTIFANGWTTSSKIMNLAARHKNGEWIIVYLGGNSILELFMKKLGVPQTVSINLNAIGSGKKIVAFWIDPRSGETINVDQYGSSGQQTFQIPDSLEDAILVLEVSHN